MKIVHTSVHGVGHAFVQSAFKAFDLRPPYAVEEQKDPDPEFPTVKYPNPEEGEGVLVGYTPCMRSGRSRAFFGLKVCVLARVCLADAVLCAGRQGGGYGCVGE